MVSVEPFEWLRRCLVAAKLLAFCSFLGNCVIFRMVLLIEVDDDDSDDDDDDMILMCWQGLSAIGQDVLALAAKAREGKLQPHEFQVSCPPLVGWLCAKSLV